MGGTLFYSSLILNFFRLIVNNTTIIKHKIATSLSTDVIPSPSIIIAFTAEIYHRAGTIFESNCNGNGIFSIGNIMPESIMTGIMNAIPEINMAACWELVIVETNKPTDNDKNMYSNDTTIKLIKLPTMGTFNTKTDNRMVVVKLTHERTK